MVKKSLKNAGIVLLIITCIFSMTIQFNPIENSNAKSKVKLNHKSITLVIGKSKKLKVRGTWRKVKWRSSNKSIARVSKRGVVKARKSGKCKIYAKVKGRRAMKCTVTVISREVYNAKKLRTLILKKGKKLSDGKISGIYFKQFEGSYEHDDPNMVDNSPREPSSHEIKYSTSLTNNAFKQFNLLLKKYGYSMNKIGFTKWSFNKEYESISFY